MAFLKAWLNYNTMFYQTFVFNFYKLLTFLGGKNFRYINLKMNQKGKRFMFFVCFIGVFTWYNVSPVEGTNWNVKSSIVSPLEGKNHILVFS